MTSPELERQCRNCVHWQGHWMGGLTPSPWGVCLLLNYAPGSRRDPADTCDKFEAKEPAASAR